MDHAKKISEKQTLGAWIADSAMLASTGDLGLWDAAFENFFRDRLHTRYFLPMAAIERDSANAWGKGFSIVTIQCSLIEFLQSTYEGLSYNRPAVPPYEYQQSGQMFIRFLTSHAPFSASFPQPLAAEFYDSVRNGLLHEARTKGDWYIHKGEVAGPLFEQTGGRKTVFWKAFLEALSAYVNSYKTELLLPANDVLRDNFKRKLHRLFTT